VQEWRKTRRAFHAAVVRAYMQHVQDNAAESVRRVIDRIHDASFAYEMDQGTWIKVRISVDKDSARRPSTSPAPRRSRTPISTQPEPVTRAGGALCLSRHGRRRHSDECGLPAADQHHHSETCRCLSPEYPGRGPSPATWDTSQAVTDCLFGALGSLAAAQGTMNQSQFRERPVPILRDDLLGLTRRVRDSRHLTPCTPNMTNTRLTDPEVLEFRYPVLLEDFHIRTGSGGRGEWSAGDGVRRTIRFLEKMDCTILSGHRRVRPFGLAGGESGQVGENAVRRHDGRMEKLEARMPP